MNSKTTQQQSTEDRIKDLAELAASVEELLRQTASQTGERIAAARAKAEESLRVARTSYAAGEFSAMRSSLLPGSVDEYVRSHTWTAVGIAALTGVVTGMLVAAHKKKTAIPSKVDFASLVNSVADRFQVEHALPVTRDARRALVSPALPHKRSVDAALAKGSITMDFLESCVITVLFNAAEIAKIHKQPYIAETTVLESMKRYCPYVFWC